MLQKNLEGTVVPAENLITRIPAEVNLSMRERKYFGTDGVRGVVGGQLMNPDFLLDLGWAVGKILCSQGEARVLMGKDTRESGDMLEVALQAGLLSAGVDIYSAGIIPGPAIAHLTRSLKADVGIMISASHNYYHDNGLKFYTPAGTKLSDEMECMIEDQLNQSATRSSPSKWGRCYSIPDASGRYIEFCKTPFLSLLKLNGLRLVIDCAHGAAFRIAPQIFTELGAQVSVLSDQPNGKNINEHCGATDVRQLQKTVIEKNAHAGLAFDGDADRLIMVDDQGELVDGDEILCILAFHPPMEQIAYSGIVGTVMTNLGLEQALRQQGIGFSRAAVGDRYVLEMLQEKGWILGGESSGHIINRQYAMTGDGIITALQVLSIMQKTKRELHVLKKTMVKRPQQLINVPISGTTVNLHREERILEAIRKAEKRLNPEGRILIRPSGTEPVIRVMVEGNDESEVNHIAHQLANLIKGL